MRRLVVRFVGFVLVIFGLLGVGGSIVAFEWISKELDDVRASSLLRPPSSQDTRPLRAVNALLTDASVATSSTGDSLAAAQDSLLAGAGASSELSTALSSLSVALNLEFLGSRPFADVTDPMMVSSVRLQELSHAIMATRASLDQSRADLQRLEQDLDLLAQQVEPMARVDPTGAMVRGINTVETLGNGVLVVFAMQSLLMFGTGLALLAIPLSAAKP